MEKHWGSLPIGLGKSHSDFYDLSILPLTINITSVLGENIYKAYRNLRRFRRGQDPMPYHNRENLPLMKRVTCTGRGLVQQYSMDG
jgi:hypothetical protein